MQLSDVIHTVMCLAIACALACVTACARALPPPLLRATLSLTAEAREQHNPAVLVLPTECIVVRGWETVCDLDYPSKATKAVSYWDSFASIIDPLIWVKLELAGFSLAHGSQLLVHSADRLQQTIQRSERGPKIRTESTQAAQTIFHLGAADRVAAARSIGLALSLRTTVYITETKASRFIEIHIEMHDLATSARLWTASCDARIEAPRMSASLVANCAANAVLAHYAPAALIGLVSP